MQPQEVSRPPTVAESAEELVDRLTHEGFRPALEACRQGGLPSISLWAGIRLCKSGKLEAIKVSGRWMSTTAAVRRYLIGCAQAEVRS